jgi:AcrR family transcriptional regulator
MASSRAADRNDRPPRPARARPLPGPARREAILEAAAGLFAERGYAETSTAAIAARAGIQEPTLYRHFAGKMDLYVACVDRASLDVLARWREIAARAPSPLAALGEVGRWYVGQLAAHPEHLILRHRAFLRSEPALADRMRAHYRETFAFVRELFARARAAREIAADTDVDAHAWLFMALGAVLDQTEALDLRGHLDPDMLQRVAALMAPAPPEDAP